MKKVITCILTSIALFSASAQAYECVGKVTNVVVGPSGILVASFGSINWVYLCAVSENYNGVPPETCKSMLSILMSAKLADRNVQFWFDDPSNNCTNAAHPAWAPLKNWYFGPALL